MTVFSEQTARDRRCDIRVVAGDAVAEPENVANPK